LEGYRERVGDEGAMSVGKRARVKAGTRYTLADIWQGYGIRLSEWDWFPIMDHAIMYHRGSKSTLKR